VRPTALVLDFGGVVIKTPFEIVEPFERRAGIPPGTLQWHGPFAPERDELWRAMQRNEISERAYWALRAEEAGRAVAATGAGATAGAGVAKTWNTHDLITRVFGGPESEFLRPEAIEAIAAARAAGIAVAVLTNDLAAFHGKAWYDALSVAADISVLVDASVTGVLKPEPGAYAQVLDELGIEPHAAVFVDDQPRNVEGAHAFGLHAVWFDVTQPGESFDRALAHFELTPSLEGC
jgi:putative hydrolase of the HAD superfamily